MKIASTLQRTSSDFEQRKRLLARKEMDQAYKKNAKFTEASQNPLLAALENLLSGKAEKDLLDQDVEVKKNLNSTPFTQIEKLTQPEVKEDLKELRITEKEVEEKPLYVGDSLDGEVFKQLSSEVKRDVEAPTVFGKELEKELFTRTFSKAKSTYSTHIAMVKNSYRSYNEPQFSMVV